MLTDTEISEDSVTAFYIFFLIKNYQRILDPNPLTQFSIFSVPQLLTKSRKKIERLLQTDYSPVYFDITGKYRRLLQAVAASETIILHLFYLNEQV